MTTWMQTLTPPQAARAARVIEIAKAHGQSEATASDTARLVVTREFDLPGVERLGADAQATLREYYDWDTDEWTYTYGATSFAALRKAEQAESAYRSINRSTGQFKDMISNIMWSSEIADKGTAIRALTEEFVREIETIASSEATPAKAAESDSESATLSEQGGHVIDLAESADGEGAVHIKVRLIQPGWGNTQDNNYYPAEMLREYAKVFEGVKMYESDHRPQEKSNRTWVSTVRRIIGFDASGAPLAEVVAHEPNFIARVRNLHKENMLSCLECSILGSGRAHAGAVDGRNGKIVEAITSARAVDWVTRAGAGGAAIELMESNREGDHMAEEPSDLKEGREPDGATTVPIAEDAQGQNASESHTDADPADGTPSATPEPVAEGAAGATPQDAPSALTAEAVARLLEASRLPPVAQRRLEAHTYLTEAAVAEAIEAERSYLSEVLGAGKPTHLGESQHAGEVPMTRERFDTRLGEIIDKYM
jgi:hypothetical protein